MNYHFTIEGLSAGLAGTFLFWVFLAQWFSSETLKKKVVLFCLLVALIFTALLCGYNNMSFMMSVLPWGYLLLGCIIFHQKKFFETQTSALETHHG
jgi:biotin transporter BioY